MLDVWDALDVVSMLEAPGTSDVLDVRSMLEAPIRHPGDPQSRVKIKV